MRQEARKADRTDQAALASGNQPIFYFDRAFRTWAEVERRAQLNLAITTLLEGHPVR